MEDGTVSEYREEEIEDGTVERDNERQKNLDLYGVELTDEQVERGDLELYDNIFKIHRHQDLLHLLKHHVPLLYPHLLNQMTIYV